MAPSPVTDSNPLNRPKRPILYTAWLLPSSSVRLWLCRWVIATAIICSYYSIRFYEWVKEEIRNSPFHIKRLEILYAVLAVWGMGTLFLILLHHLLCSLGPQVAPLPAWIDLILMFFEIVPFFVLSSVLFHAVTMKVELLPTGVAFGLLVAFALAISLFILFILKLLDIVRTKGQDWKKTVDVCPQLHETSSGKIVWWAYIGSVLLGRRPWEEKLTGEGLAIRAFRGILTLSIVVLLFLYGAYTIVLLPIAEAPLVPIAEYRGTIREGFAVIMPVWKLIILHSASDVAGPEGSTAFLDATSVTATWDEGIEGTVPECTPTLIDLESYIWPDTSPFVRVVNGFKAVSFQCTRPVSNNFWETDYQQTSGDPDSLQPDLQLKVDFTGLLPQNTRKGRSRMYHAVLVYVALDEDITKVIRSSHPTYLLPGMHLLGVAEPFIRQSSSNIALSTMGYEVHDTFVAVRMREISTNPGPIPGVDVSAAGNPNISSMLIVRGPQLMDDVVYQDNRTKSVISGLSTLGGLGSILSTLLAILFGAGLTRTIIRTKPLSAFGLLHALESAEARINEECERRYPRLRDEIAALKKDPGVLAFVFDNLIDIDALGFNRTTRAFWDSDRVPHGSSSSGQDGDEESQPGAIAETGDLQPNRSPAPPQDDSELPQVII